MFVHTPAIRIPTKHGLKFGGLAFVPVGIRHTLGVFTEPAQDSLEPMDASVGSTSTGQFVAFVWVANQFCRHPACFKGNKHLFSLLDGAAVVLLRRG